MWMPIIPLLLTVGRVSIQARLALLGVTQPPPELPWWLSVQDIVAELVAFLIIGLFTLFLVRPIRALVKRLARRVLPGAVEWSDSESARRKRSGSEGDYERLYLGWLKASLAERSRPLVPTPAHTKELLDPNIKRAQRAKLLRFDVEDYRRNPDLNESDLSMRAEYGKGVRINNLVKELRRFRKIVVLGEPGSGKSVCLRQLALDLCEEGLTRIERGQRPRTLPIYVEMSAYDGWRREATREPLPVLEFLRTSLREHSSISEAPSTHALLDVSLHLETILMTGRATLIFDALDEMPQNSYQERYGALKQFVVTHEAAGSNRFVFSCRLLDYDSSFHVSEVIIDRFDRKRIRAFLKMNAPPIADALYKEILNDKALEDLVSNPFFLQALTYVNLATHRENGLMLPLARGELVKEFAETLLQQDVGIKQKVYLALIDGGLSTLRKFLSELAFALQERGDGRTSAQPDALTDIWRRYPQWKSLLWIARRARILGKSTTNPDSLVDIAPPALDPPPRIEFMHHRLQEYFAATQLGARLSRSASIDRYVEDIWWQETVVFAIGIVAKPDPIIRRMLAARSDVTAWIDQVVTRASIDVDTSDIDAEHVTEDV